MKSKWLRIACLGLTAAMLPFAAACTDPDSGSGNNGGNGGNGGDSTTYYDNEQDVLVLSSGDFDGVFNPFFSTSAYDSTIVGQTQISMLGSDDEGLNVTYGPDEPVVTLDYDETMYDANGNVTQTGSANGTTVYQMVIKNDILFSDGVPLTAHDVLFNLYVYLDPNYTGSSTLYSTDIVGLADYQAQRVNADDNYLESINRTFDNFATMRTNVILAYVDSANYGNYESFLKTYNSSRRTYFTENGASDGYEDYTVEDIQADIAAIGEQFEADLLSTYNGIDMTTYENEYSFDSTKTWQGFFYEIGLVSRSYHTGANGLIIYDVDENGKFIIDWDMYGIDYNAEYTRDEAIEFAYDALYANQRSIATILTGFTTGDTMLTNFAAEDREYFYDLVQGEDGTLTVPSISGIKIKDASEFNGDTTYTAGEYEMLEIKINGVDPRAKWNFAFTVAPMHYYSTPELVNEAMADTDYSESFGVDFNSLSFMNEIRRRNSVPVGAGVYQASTRYDQTFVWEQVSETDYTQTQASAESWNTVSDGFLNNNIIYFIRNDNFDTTGGNIEEVHNATIKHIQYKVTGTAQVMTALQGGDLDIADPSATTDNTNAVTATPYLSQVTVQTAGYGYIGINAKFIPNIYVRRAIMTTFDPELVQAYYPNSLSEPVYRSYSITSWVYDAFPNDGVEEWNPEPYYEYDSTGELAREYLLQGGCTYQNGRWYDKDGTLIELTFTIAGETRDHPATNTFLEAQRILESIGISANVVTNARALYLLASGGLEIWAAAWSSSVDPDLYQVYHSESQATSVLNWGYDAILDDASYYSEETRIMRTLDSLIEEGREYLDQANRALVYREASDYIMDLAVEFPLYQRSDMYVYNNTKIDGSTLYGSPSPYMSPLAEIWKVSFITAD